MVCLMNLERANAWDKNAQKNEYYVLWRNDFEGDDILGSVAKEFSK